MLRAACSRRRFDTGGKAAIGTRTTCHPGYRCYQNGGTIMPKNDALARRWQNGDGGRWRLYLAEFTQEEIAESACTAPSFPAICNRPATYAAAGIPPILRWPALLRWLSGNGDRHPTRCMRLKPGTLHPGASPHFRLSISSRGGGRILERKEDLRPTGRWIRPPTEVVNSICNLTQFNAIFGNFTQMRAISRSFTKTNANYRKFQQDRGIAVADAQAILRMGLTSPDTLL